MSRVGQAWLSPPQGSDKRGSNASLMDFKSQTSHYPNTPHPLYNLAIGRAFQYS